MSMPTLKELPAVAIFAMATALTGLCTYIGVIQAQHATEIRELNAGCQASQAACNDEIRAVITRQNQYLIKEDSINRAQDRALKKISRQK
jgi:hypothetical protein